MDSNFRKWGPVLAGIFTSVIAVFGQEESHLSGGETTVFQTSQNAFSLPLANISRANKRAHVVGNSFFNSNWTVAPASASGRDGLGPLFNARSCSGCHMRDGRGSPEDGISLLFRVGDKQIRPFANDGFTPDGKVKIGWDEITMTFSDGTPVSLRKPTYLFGNVEAAPRIAPPVFGVGLLEAISEKTILALTDPDDKNGDGISGNPNFVLNAETQKRELGRFGWKANQPTVRSQTAAAFFSDIGITTSIHNDSDSEPPEADDRVLERIVLYQQTLAPPAQRDFDKPEVIRGRVLFEGIGCTSCHIPELKTGSHPDGISELENQTIRPFTDLLLHDMGDGLADGRPDSEASGRQWRTPPLWGIGLTKTVNGHTFFLHDGRARDLTEAILWHDGEAEKSRDAFVRMSRTERADLLAFLNSL